MSTIYYICNQLSEEDEGKGEIFKEKYHCKTEDDACCATIPRKPAFFNVHWMARERFYRRSLEDERVLSWGRFKFRRLDFSGFI